MAKAKRELKVIELSGTPYEIGFQYGSACPELRNVLDLTYKGMGLGREAVAQIVPKYVSPLEKFAPEVLDGFKGIAEGAKVGFEEICFLNASFEIGIPGMLGGCTSFAATGEATSNGGTIVGQNLDWTQETEDALALLKIKPNEGPQILAVTMMPGCLGMMGLNSAGLGVDGNLVVHRASISGNGGVPMMALLSKVLTSENIGKAFGTVAQAGEISGTGALLAVLLASREGDIVDVETIPHDLGALYPEKGILVHANHFETDRFKSGDMMTTFSPCSFIRSERLRVLMAKHHGKLSVDIMKELMQDHNNYPDSVCRHFDKTMPPAHWFKTCATLISDLSEQKMYIAWGNPCENEFVEYKL